MTHRILTIATLLVAAVPALASAQTPPAPANRFTFQVGGGPLGDGGYNAAAGFSFSPRSALDLAVNVEQLHQPARREQYSDGFSLTRGGTSTYLSGEVRVSLSPRTRLSPYAFAGVGGGVSRPTVSWEFPDAVSNALGVVYAGAGLRARIRNNLSVFADARALLEMEGGEAFGGRSPVRVGLSWRF